MLRNAFVISDALGLGSIDKEKHDECWETLLFNQFHDILPGSSINEVYRQTDKDYAMISEYGNTSINGILSSIATNVKGANKGDILVYNPSGFEFSGAVNVGEERVIVNHIPAKGYAVATPVKAENNVTFHNNVLENRFYSLTFDKNMNICSAYDKVNNREMLKNGKVISFTAYEDLPKEYDAWELAPFHTEKAYQLNDVTSVNVVKDIDRTGVTVTRVFGKSTITDTVWLYNDRPYVEFDDNADWHSKHVILKRIFPLDILSDVASCDTQFGFVDRPTHKNTSWDWAKFEVCAHKYVDVSEGGYGIAVINESKYGHGLINNDISLSLLRGPTYPDPDCDMGKHSFKYALMSHSGSLSTSSVLKEATMFNIPCVALPVGKTNGTLPKTFFTVKAEAEQLVLDTVKPAEDGSGTVIRMYEGRKTRGVEKLTLGMTATKAYLCDMLENEQSELEIIDGTITVPFKPFEIITIKVS